MASNDPSGSGSVPRGLLGRKGTPVGKDTRLSSIRGPRDLTLGGAKKKTFQPNLAARRDKTKDDAATEKTSSPADKPGPSGKGRGKKGERGRGRGRGRGIDVIQSHSIFEEGPTDRLKKPSHGDGERSYASGSLGSSGVKKEKKGAHDNKKILDHLLRDDFMVDEKLDCDDPTMTPVCLPLRKHSPTTTAKPDAKTDDKPAVKVKEEPMDLTDATSETKSESLSSWASQPISEESMSKPRTVGQLFMESSKSEQSKLLFIQLPDTLPGDPKQEDDRPTSSNNAAASKQAKKPTKETELSERMGQCHLSDYNEGYIGKLQIRKSGKAQLQLGNISLQVMLGTPPGFLQDLASIRVDESGGDLCMLGHVQHKLLCVPDFENMMEER